MDLDIPKLSDICYEPIKGTFYYGIFDGFKLVIDKATGYFNATKLCEQGGKKFTDWKMLKKSESLVEYYGLGPRNEDCESQTPYTGTYVPKELILDIACWVSADFYYKCNNIIVNYFINEYKNMDRPTIKKRIKNIEEKVAKLASINTRKETLIIQQKDKIDQLLASNKKLEEHVNRLSLSLESVKEQNNELLSMVYSSFGP